MSFQLVGTVNCNSRTVADLSAGRRIFFIIVRVDISTVQQFEYQIDKLDRLVPVHPMAGLLQRLDGRFREVVLDQQAVCDAHTRWGEMGREMLADVPFGIAPGCHWHSRAG